jgi:hypothetical protein
MQHYLKLLSQTMTQKIDYLLHYAHKNDINKYY